MFGLKPGWSIEAPPDRYARGQTQTGHTTEVPNLTPEQANYLCHLAGVWKNEPKGFPVACYNPTTDQVILPASKYWPSQDELSQMRAHEWAHARGWRHNDDGTGTSDASLAPAAPSPTPSADDAAQDAVQLAKRLGGSVSRKAHDALSEHIAQILHLLHRLNLHHNIG